MKSTTSPTAKYGKIIFIVGIVVHMFFYISAHKSHTLDIFFEHVTRGQDFFQIPNGAYSYINGGGLQGDIPYSRDKYIDCCGVNPNVYLPAFTLAIGIPLQFFQPWTAFYMWVGVHTLVTVVTIVFLWQKFRKHRFLYLSLSIFLLFSYHYYEIQHAQFHFLLNFFVLFFLYEISKYKISNSQTSKKEPSSELSAGVWMFLSLLVKPIGLVWVLPLLIYRKHKAVLVGLSLFAIALFASYIIPEGQYFFDNLKGASRLGGTSYNLAALSKFVDFDLNYLKYLSYLIAGLLIIYQYFKRPHIFTVISLWLIWTILFYGGVYHYYYTTVATIISLGILANKLKLNILTLIAVIGLTLPTPIVFLKLTGSPDILPEKELSIVALWSSTFLIFLAAGLIKSAEGSKNEVT